MTSSGRRRVYIAFSGVALVAFAAFVIILAYAHNNQMLYIRPAIMNNVTFFKLTYSNQSTGFNVTYGDQYIFGLYNRQNYSICYHLFARVLSSPVRNLSSNRQLSAGCAGSSVDMYELLNKSGGYGLPIGKYQILVDIFTGSGAFIFQLEQPFTVKPVNSTNGGR